MNKSMQLGSIAGIRIQVHWSFLIIVGWVVATSGMSGMSALATAMNVAFILVLFGCVLLHELGHALAARTFGIPTRDITLLPIGGVARLERMPQRPFQELVVALAGPAVNVVIAFILLAILLLTVDVNNLAAIPLRSGGFLQQLLIVNVTLVIFNMIPAFPLDGGRVFRALLAFALDYVTATRVATTVGQVCSVGFGLLGLVNPFMLLIAIFIFFSAAAESQQVAVKAQFAGFRVSDGMLRTFKVVPADGLLSDWFESLLDGTQRDYPVVRDGNLIGMLRHSKIFQSADREALDPSLRIADLMDADVKTVEATGSLQSATETILLSSRQIVPVTANGELVGLLDTHRMIDLARARKRLRRPANRMTTILPIQHATSLNEAARSPV